MADHPGDQAGRERDEAAAYVAELTSELAQIARRHGLDALGYLLDMARMEAESATRNPKAPDTRSKVLNG